MQVDTCRDETRSFRIPKNIQRSSIDSCHVEGAAVLPSCPTQGCQPLAHLPHTFWSVVNTQWPLCCPCSKSWQVSEAGGFLCIRGGQQQWEFVPGAAPQWWVAGPFLWPRWQGTLLILTGPDQLTGGKHTKKPPFFIFPFYQVSCWQHYFAPSAFQWWQSELHSTHCWNQLECWHIPADWASRLRLLSCVCCLPWADGPYL